MAAGFVFTPVRNEFPMDRSLRLHESYDVKQTRSRGKSGASGPLVARVLPNALEPARNRYTVVAGKKVGKAHERNRCKRVTREALRLMHPVLRQGYDVVVIIRGGVDELTGRDVAERSLGEIFRKTGLLAREQ
jgi:ribonuclease P protein component